MPWPSFRWQVRWQRERGMYEGFPLPPEFLPRKETSHETLFRMGRPRYGRSI